MTAVSFNLDNNSQSDKRYLPRWISKNNVSYLVEESPEMKIGYTKDISCSGACICVEELPKIDQKVQLNIQLSDSDSVELHGNVIWTRSVGSEQQMGVNFFETTEKAQDLILQYAFEFDTKKLTKHWFKDWGK